MEKTYILVVSCQRKSSGEWENEEHEDTAHSPTEFLAVSRNLYLKDRDVNYYDFLSLKDEDGIFYSVENGQKLYPWQ